MDYLEHFGVKGMKWGVRRTDAQLGHPSSSQSPRMATTSDLLGNALKGLSTPTMNASQMRATDKQAEAFKALGNAALSQINISPTPAKDLVPKGYTPPKTTSTGGSSTSGHYSSNSGYTGYRGSTNYINPYGGMSSREAADYRDWMSRH